MERHAELTGNFQRETIIALNRLGRAVTSSLKIEDVCDSILSEISALLNAEGVAILLPRNQDELIFAAVSGFAAAQLKGATMPRRSGVAGYVMETGEAVWINSHSSSTPGLSIYREIESVSAFRSESLLAVPLQHDGKVIGVLEAAHSRTDALTGESLPVLTAAANWAAIAISNALLHEQAQQLREQQALHEERARLARELHDVVTQCVYSMSVLAGAWRRQIEAGTLTPQKAHIEELGELAEQAMRDIRLMIYELRPAELEEAGLLGALYQRLEAVEKRAGVRTKLTINGDANVPNAAHTGDSLAGIDFYRLPSSVEAGLFRITQEALNNALKHSKATEIEIRIQFGPQQLDLEVRDNGRGFDDNAGEDAGSGFGMLSMKERAKQIGGAFSLKSASGYGTIVRISGVPYREDSSIEEGANVD